MIRERDLERAFVKHIVRTGGEVRKVKFLDRRGAPDRIVMYPDGELTWVELKREGEDLEPHQKREHKRLEAMGQVVVVVRTREDYEALFPSQEVTK